MSAYECGMTPVGDCAGALLGEVLSGGYAVHSVRRGSRFLYPWAVILRDLKHFGLWEMFVYIGIVLVGFFYVWKKGVLDWGLRVDLRADMRRGER